MPNLTCFGFVSFDRKHGSESRLLQCRERERERREGLPEFVRGFSETILDQPLVDWTFGYLCDADILDHWTNAD